MIEKKDEQNNQENEISGTQRFIYNLMKLKEGELGKLRGLAGKELDESLYGFDLFTSIWWPLREKWAPKRSISWLIIKLYAQFPFEPNNGDTLATKLGYFIPYNENERARYQFRFDNLLNSKVEQLEYHLCWALNTIMKNFSNEININWVQLTNDLSHWDDENTKIKWVNDFLKINNNI